MWFSSINFLFVRQESCLLKLCRGSLHIKKKVVVLAPFWKQMLGHHHYSFLGATVKGRGVTPMQLLSNFTLEHLVPREYVTSIFQSTLVVPTFFPAFCNNSFIRSGAHT